MEFPFGATLVDRQIRVDPNALGSVRCTSYWRMGRWRLVVRLLYDVNDGRRSGGNCRLGGVSMADIAVLARHGMRCYASASAWYWGQRDADPAAFAEDEAHLLRVAGTMLCLDAEEGANV